MESCIIIIIIIINESLSVLINHIIKLSDFRIKRLNVEKRNKPAYLFQGPEETRGQPEERKK